MAQYYQPHEKVNWLSLPGDYPFNMKRQENYRWWKPLLVALIGGIVFLVIFMLATSLNNAIQSAMGNTDDASITESLEDITNPVGFGLSLLMIAGAIPALGIAMKLTKLGGLRTLSSIEGKLRWDRIRAFAPWAALVVVVFMVGETLGSLVIDGYDVAIGTVRLLPLSAVLVIIFAPLQCAGEEYFFRGYLMQTLCSWIPIVIIPVIIQMVIFGSMHIQYNILGGIETALTGLVAMYVAIKTGGLEGSICIHAANNTISMLFACVYSGAVPGSDMTIAGFLVGGILLNAAYAVVALWVAKRKGFILKEG